MDIKEQQKIGEHTGKLEQAISILLTVDFDYVMKLAEKIRKEENNAFGEKIHSNFESLVGYLEQAMEVNADTARLLRNKHMAQALAIFQIPGVHHINVKLVGITHKVLIAVESLTIMPELITIAEKVNSAPGNRIQYSFSYLPLDQANEKCTKEGFDRIWPSPSEIEIAKS